VQEGKLARIERYAAMRGAEKTPAAAGLREDGSSQHIAALLFPGIENHRMGMGEIAGVAGNDGEIVVERRCGEQTVNGG
jgi:hypothetical protein